MKAARFHGPGDIRIDDVPEPTVGPGQVKVDVEWCGICGTDLHEYLEGPIFIPPKGSPHPLTGEEMPVVMGHEFAGVVSEVGDGVTHLKEGDRVVVEPYDVCGECAACRSGRYNICRKLGFVGLDGQQGGFAEKCVVGARWVAPARRHPHRSRRARRAAGRGLPRGTALGDQAGRHRGWCSAPARSAWSPPRR